MADATASLIRPTVLCVLDGWGHRPDPTDNAVALARTPVFDRLWQTWPHGLLSACGEDVGLPAGQIGNSEVGHMNLGAGRVVYQDLPRIDQALATGEHRRAEAFQALVAALRTSGGCCHLIGLVSPGGVHAHQNHGVQLAQALAQADVPVVVHAFTDGRDVGPKTAADHLARFAADLASLPGVSIGTVCGRYFAMDRDHRWDRVALAYDAMVAAKGRTAADAVAAVLAGYADGVGDEFLPPTVIGTYDGMHDGDGLLCANFRADRVRQVLDALTNPAFRAFERSRAVTLAAAVGMVTYGDALAARMNTLFPSQPVEQELGQVIADAGLRQLRIAETEKFAHVTFFFNGGKEKPFPGEERILVPSPKVATYDLKPEMSAEEVTDRLTAAITGGGFPFVLVNFANPDMVGHTGDLTAAIRAVETVDVCLGRLEAAVLHRDGTLLVTADHGNCEIMRDPETGGPHTAHTLDPVPAVLVNGPSWVRSLAAGRLADVAPTLLALMGIDVPQAMTGRSLLTQAEQPPVAA